MEFCRSISEREPSVARQMIAGCSLVELRADLMALKAEELVGLIPEAERVIVTCHNDSAEEIYLAAIDAGAWGIDIALESPKELIERVIESAHRGGVRVILSHHYSTTPSLEELINKAHKALDLGADIVKIITTATTTAEALVPLELYRHLPAERLIAFAMGLKGAYSRRLSLLLGAPYTYVAPTKESATAAGQPTAEQLAESLSSHFDLERVAIPSRVEAPTSKSEAQRAIVAATLAKGTSIIYHAHACEDTAAAIELSRALGAEVSQQGSTLTIVSPGAERIGAMLGREITTLCVGSSALLARLTIPIVASLLRSGEVRIEGRGTLLRRSLGDAIELIERYGALGEHTDYHLPLTITHGAEFPADMELEGGGSSQSLSGLMMASALIDRDEMTRIVVHNAVSRPYLWLTAETMEKFGGIATPQNTEPLIIDIEPEPFAPSQVRINTDWSSASYLAAAYAIAQSGYRRAERYTLEGATLGTLQADEVLLMLLATSGANISVEEDIVEFLPSESLGAISYDATHTPDLIPTLAVVALFAEGESVIGGLGRLENKESNRVESLVENLVAIGGDLRIEGDRLLIRGGAPLHAAPILAHDDHRIAMAFTVAALFMEQRPTIDNKSCVAKSFPEFFEILNNKR